MLIEDFLSAYIHVIERALKAFDQQRNRQRVIRSPIGEIIGKVEAAQRHLTDAITATDLLKEQAIQERSHLDRILSEINKKRLEQKHAAQELETAKELLTQDKERLRSVLGINPKKERQIGFISGVIASLLATSLWLLGTYLWKIFSPAIFNPR